ncbi:MAG: monovalent cation/H(+) antiporter subunit G [Candidatus Methanofastidiosia archaeon]|jgi:multicomponent Na+:H+ antiporter subunit G
MMQITEILIVIADILIVIGAFFLMVGALGLLRLPDMFTRMHAATKCTTLGAMCTLLGVAIIMKGSYGIKALLIIVFVVLGNPTSAHAIARAAYRTGTRMKIGSFDAFKEEVE